MIQIKNKFKLPSFYGPFQNFQLNKELGWVQQFSKKII